jgi:hypothetical protein
VNYHSKDSDYPVEALPQGTFVRVNRLNVLGIITDAFYGEKDVNNTRIIVYTIFLLPKKSFSHISSQEEKFYMTNEYEYDITGYLMMNPVDINKVLPQIEGDLWYEE